LLLLQRRGEALVDELEAAQGAAGGQRHAAVLLQLGVGDGLVERPGERRLAELLGVGVAHAAVGDHAQADAAAGGEADVVDGALLRLDGELAVGGGEHLELHAPLAGPRQQPRLGFGDLHASPPTTMSLTSRCGCPTSTGSEPDSEPHMPGSFERSSDTATIFLMESGPLPSSMAPRTGSAISPSRMM